jgi:hypothetical protein
VSDVRETILVNPVCGKIDGLHCRLGCDATTSPIIGVQSDRAAAFLGAHLVNLCGGRREEKGVTHRVSISLAGHITIGCS